MRYGLLFLMGGGIYVLLELFWRGRSHGSMFLAGGCALVLLSGIQGHFPTLSPALLYLMGAVVITAAEFLIGAVVNIRLRLAVWDYSKLPMNLYGQVCLRYSLLWYLLCAPAYGLIGLVNAF